MAPAKQVVDEPQSQVVDPAPADEPPRQVVASDDPTPDEPPEPPAAVAGEISELAWVPGVDSKLSTDDAAELVDFVDSWIRGDGLDPAIEYRKGVVFAESREDRGDDGPPPRSAEPEAYRLCGTQSVWMRQSLKAAVENNPLTCSRNVCWYGGSEYTPSGYLLFHRYKTVDDQQTWALDAWIQLYDAALPPTTVHHNENDILELIERLPKTCKGEPLGAY
jgi:hypothetical protein